MEQKYRVKDTKNKVYYFTLVQLVYGELQTTEYCDIEFKDVDEWDIFTGFEDKNKKEIYEGDKIRSYHNAGTVVFSSGCFGCFFNEQEFTTLADIWERGDGHKVEIIK